MKPVVTEMPPRQARGQADWNWRLALLIASGALFAAASTFAAAGMPTLVPIGVLLGAAFAFGAAINVPLRPRGMDDEAACRPMAAAGDSDMRTPCDFDEEVRIAYLVQQAVLDLAPFEKRDPNGRKVALPLRTRREVSDLVRARTGHCFDRSRAIETILRLYGLDSRHVAIFSRSRGDSWLRTLLQRGAPSHSMSEVRTRRGWMAIDSNFRFVGLSASGEPFDMKKLAALPKVGWDSRNREMPPKIAAPFIYVYGLYSRHGRFYPPYTGLPNVNWLELTYNLR